ncbi:hypothetical protein COO60DRAFT_1549343 [Scenedesmus sp. NREL 46B-D3]|nr:hypothetical protein COO60DRAFT_1549343 [Scenedesmus sp. NREL 46B-D3]
MLGTACATAAPAAAGDAAALLATAESLRTEAALLLGRRGAAAAVDTVCGAAVPVPVDVELNLVLPSPLAVAAAVPAVSPAGLGLLALTTRRLTAPGWPLAVLAAASPAVAAAPEDDPSPAELSAVLLLAARGLVPAARTLPEGDLTPCCLEPERLLKVACSDFTSLFFLFFLPRRSWASSRKDREMPAALITASWSPGDMMCNSY